MRSVVFVLFAASLVACEMIAPPSPRPEIDGPYVFADDGVPIAYDVAGSGAPTVVLLHGWSCDRTYWREQVDDLARAHRVIAVDLAGHGESGANRTDWTFEGLADDVIAVLEEEDVDDAVVVGHSMGGPIALLVAQRAPERVDGIVAVEALHDADAPRMTDEQARPFLGAYETDFAGTCARFARAMFPEGTDPALVDEVAADMASAPPEVAVGLARRFPDFVLKDAMAGVTVPVRSINSARSMPTNTEANREYLPDYDSVLMANVGHFPMLERPVEFNALLRTVLEGIGRQES
ncbi:MAG: alpha/beta fold hydrolase [Planctomycetota bacterium JB042]